MSSACIEYTDTHYEGVCNPEEAKYTIALVKKMLEDFRKS